MRTKPRRAGLAKMSNLQRGRPSSRSQPANRLNDQELAEDFVPATSITD